MFTLIIALVSGLAAGLTGYAVAAATIRRLRTAYRQAVWQADHDPLTGLPVRRVAAAALDARVATGMPTMVVLLDLDRFKQVNDTYGHQAGDQVLVTVAARLRRWAAGHGGLACRLAGDELLAITPTTADVDGLLTSIGEPVTVDDDGTQSTVTVAATAGVTVFCGRGVAGWSQLLRQADVALYQARHHNRAHLTYHPGMRMPAASGRRAPRLRDQHPGHAPQPVHPPRKEGRS